MEKFEVLRRSAQFICFLCFVFSFVLVSPVRCEEVAMSGCLKGSSCDQCPPDRYTKTQDGVLLCCHGCEASVLYYGEFPQDWCVCHGKDTNEISSRTLVFPGQGSSGTPGDKEDEARVMSSAVAPAVGEALTLLADTLEDLNARVTRLEYIISNAADSLTSDTINRVGAATPPRSPATASDSSSCPNDFRLIGDVCYHVSAWTQNRATWENANISCEKLGGKLAEPLTNKQFKSLAQYLSLAKETTGYSYWLGGLYLSPSWRWVYKGGEVDLSPLLWISLNEENRRVSAGDISGGRCLAFSFIHRDSDYAFAGSECAFDKYYVCELLERTHRRI